MDKMPLQTLQIYRKVEKIPAEVQIRRMTIKLEEIKKDHPALPSAAPIIPTDEPQVKSIEWQNQLSSMEKELQYWITDYRNLIGELYDLDWSIPKTKHDLTESDEKAKENVNKIIKVEDIKEQILNQFKEICLRCEESEDKSRRRIRQLESQLIGTQAKVENLEYRLKRKEKDLSTSLA